MLYTLIYFLNLALAVVMMVGTYWVANNEVRLCRKFIVAALCASCTIEVAILFIYVPAWHPSFSDEMMTTLLFAKFILKPALDAYVIYNVMDLRAKMRYAAPHGQVVAHVVPQPLETIEHNQKAAALGKIDQAVDTAKTLHAEEAMTQKLNDSSAEREAKPS